MLIFLSVTQLLMRKEKVSQEFSILLTIMRKDGHQYVNFTEAGLETGMTQYLEMGLTRTQRILSFHAVTTKAVRFLTVNGTPGLHVTTRNTESWTPIAARTCTKLQVIYIGLLLYQPRVSGQVPYCVCILMI